MFWLFFIPGMIMVIIIVTALLLGKRDRKKEALALAEKKKDLLETNPKQAVLGYLDEYKHISEYTFIDLVIGKAKVDVLYISKKGIFLLYPLNNEGVISGIVNEENWLNTTHDEFVLKNPMYHNKRDIDIISNVSTLKNHLYSLAVFTRASEINLIDVNDEHNVSKLDSLKETLDKYPDVISTDDLVIYYNNIVNASNEE